MAALLKRTVEEKTDTGFETWLKTRNAEFKGVAISDPQMISDREARSASNTFIRIAMRPRRCFSKRSTVPGRLSVSILSSRSRHWVPYGAPVE
jgi:hypothetical protein